MDQDTPEVIEDEESFADRAYRKVEELIVSLQVEPGMVLTEQGLAAQLGLGRTPIREALQRLAREHLVVIMPRRGIQVTEMSVAEQMAALEVRRELERYVAASAARRTTPGEKARFSEMAELMTRAAAQGDEVTFLRLDREFNVFAAQCARNAYAEAAIAPVEGTAEGVFKVDASMLGIGLMKEPMTLHVRKGQLVEIEGGEERERLGGLLEKADDNASNIAEFGIGTVPRGKVTGALDDKRLLGTAHIAVGDNHSIGGIVTSNIHLDAVTLDVTIELDGKAIIQDGKLVI